MGKTASLAPPDRKPGHGVSIAEVARHAGVSVATVSRVLNGKQSVKESTCRRVAASVAALGYRVNNLARSLRTDKSRLLLAMVPDMGNTFYAQIVRSEARRVGNECLMTFRSRWSTYH